MVGGSAESSTQQKPPRRLRQLARSRCAPAVGLLAVCGAAFAVRVHPAHEIVLPESGAVRLLGLDAFYHLRHAEYAAASFPHVQRWDLGTHYPLGQRSDAAGLYDLSIAAVALALDGGEPRSATVLRVAAWMPAVLGALGFAALFALARPPFGSGGALLACVLYLLSPSHALVRTALGFSDHHAAEVLLALLSAAGFGACLRDGLPLRAPRAWAHALVGAAPMAVFLFTWVGAPIFLTVLALTASALVVLGVATDAPARFGTAVFRYALALGALACATATGWPDLQMLPRLMDVLYGGIAAFAVGPLAVETLCAVAVRRGASPPRVALGALCVGALAVAAASVFDPGTFHTVDEMFAPKTLLIREHHEITPRHYWIQFGPAGVAALLSVPLAVASAWRRRDPLAAWPALLGLAVVALWVRTHDYGYTVPPFVAAMAATTVIALLRASEGRRRGVRGGLVAAVAVLLAFPLWPFDGIRRPYFRISQIAAVRTVDDGWWESMEWLADNARPLPFRLSDPVPHFPPRRERATRPRYPRGSYGVLSSWNFGGAVAAIARLPVRWSRGSDGDPTAAWLLGEAGVEAFDTVASMCRVCNPDDDMRYAIVDARIGTDFLYGLVAETGHPIDDFYTRDGELRSGDETIDHWRHSARYDRSMYATLYEHDGRGLSHLRMVYETAHQSASVSVAKRLRGGRWFYERRTHPIDSEDARSHYAAAEGFGHVHRISAGRWAFDASLASSVKVFERVDGARLVGKAPAGAARATARLSLRAGTTGRAFEYEVAAPVRGGRFELVVPYPTDGAWRSAVEVLGAYRIGFDGIGFDAGEPRSLDGVRVDAEAVERGDRIEAEPPGANRRSG